MTTASRFSNALLYGPALRVSRYAPASAPGSLPAAPTAPALAPAPVQAPAAVAPPAAPVQAGSMVPAGATNALYDRPLTEGGEGPADSFADGMGPNPGSGWGDFSRGALGVLGAITNPIGFGVTALGTGLYDALSGRTVGSTLNGLFGDVIGGDRPVSQWDEELGQTPAGPGVEAGSVGADGRYQGGALSGMFDLTAPGAATFNPMAPESGGLGMVGPDGRYQGGVLDGYFDLTAPGAADFNFGGDYGGGEGGAQSENTSSGGDNKSDTSSSEGGYGGGDAGFMRGGYTGAGSDGVVQPWRAAGTVHEGEVVWPADAVRRVGGPRSALQLLAMFGGPR